MIHKSVKKHFLSFVAFCLLLLLAVGSASSNTPDDILAMVAAKHLIERELQSPKSAKHPPLREHQPIVTKINDMKWSVDSYVDAQNGFGALMRVYYSIEIGFSYNDEGDLMFHTLDVSTW